MTTPRKLTIAAVALLVCGLVFALLLRRPSDRLAMTVQGFETNGNGIVTASILVSNTSSYGLFVKLRSSPGPMTAESGPHTGGEFLPPSRTRIEAVALPSERPCWVLASVFRTYSRNRLIERVRQSITGREEVHETIVMHIP